MGNQQLRSAANIAVAVAIVALGCDGDRTTDPGPSGAISGQFSGALVAGSTDSAATIVLRNGGAVSMSICGPVGSDFNLEVGAARAASTENCEHLGFTAGAATTYRVRVVAVAGAGAFTGCWRAGTTPCTSPTPVGMACTGAPPDDAAASIPAGYYDATRHKCGPELLTALASLASTQVVLGYTSARDSMYAFIDDLDDDDVIEDLYTGRRASGVNSRSTALAARLNAEHAWPQSRGANEDPAMSDLHALFASDSAANVTRSNYPFGAVTGAVVWQSSNTLTPNEISRLGFDATGQLVFEPRPSRRGDIARALFYFYTRYDTHRTLSYSLAHWERELPTLLQWNVADPVSAAERTRNNLVWRAQRNRNPYVDAPQFVGAVGSFR